MWGSIISAVAPAVIGGIMGNKAAKEDRKNMKAMNDANMAGFKQYEPYVDQALSGGQDAFQGVLDAGYYQGPTYAGPNTFQTGTAGNMGNIGLDMQSGGYNMMANNAGFGANANNMYNQFQGLSDAAQKDRLSKAIGYAGDNAGSLVDAVMRDSTRQLQEQTLPGINTAASGSGNVNSSRAGVADAIAKRSYDDRRSDVTSNITNNLIDRSLNQQQQQFTDQSNALTSAGNMNNQISNAYNTGLNTMGSGFGFGMQGGQALQGYDQAALNDARNRFEGNRDFNYNMYKDYKTGMLGNAPSTNNVAQANMASPTTATLGGMQTGFGFGQEYGPQIMNMLPTNFGGYGSYGGGAPPIAPRGGFA